MVLAKSLPTPPSPKKKQSGKREKNVQCRTYPSQVSYPLAHGDCKGCAMPASHLPTRCVE